MTRTHATEDDEGKTVVDASGGTVGTVTEVRDGTVYVSAAPGITDTIRSKLGWGGADTDDYALQKGRIDTISDGELRLEKTL